MIKKLLIISVLTAVGLGVTGCNHVQTRYSATISHGAPVVYYDYPVYWDYPIYRRPLYPYSYGLFGHNIYHRYPHHRHQHKRRHRR